MSFKIAKTGKLNGYDKRNEGWHIRRGKYYRAVKRKEEVPNLSARPALQKISSKNKKASQALRSTSVSQVLRRLGRETHKFRDSLGYIAAPCYKKKKKSHNTQIKTKPIVQSDPQCE